MQDMIKYMDARKDEFSTLFKIAMDYFSIPAEPKGQSHRLDYFSKTETA